MVIEAPPVETPAPIAQATFLQSNAIYQGDARLLLPRIQPESVALSFWSPPYFVGKSYERGLTFSDWQTLLRQVIAAHFQITKPGGFLAINIADILAFADGTMPRIQADTVSQKRVPITREQIFDALKEHPGFNRYQLAALLGCSEQTIQRRLQDNNVRGGKYNKQTRVKVVGGLIESWAEAAGFWMYDRRAWVKDPCWANDQWHSSSYRSVDEFEYIYVLWKPGITRVDRSRLTKQEWSDWGSRGVWQFPSVRTHDMHEAGFPVELPRRVIKLLSDPDDLITDCFIGSGTTAEAAIQLGRQYIGIDLISESVTLARERCVRALTELHDPQPKTTLSL